MSKVTPEGLGLRASDKAMPIAVEKTTRKRVRSHPVEGKPLEGERQASIYPSEIYPSKIYQSLE